MDKRMEQELMDKVTDWIKSVPLPLEGELEQQLRKLLSPSPIGSLSELTRILKPSPPYLGPGIWLRAIGTSQEGEDHA